MPGSPGNTAAELFIPIRPDGSNAPITPGSAALFKSQQTGKFCRLVPQQQNKVLCDQDTAAGATQFTYAGHGLQYNSLPLLNPGAPSPAYFAAPTMELPALPVPVRPAQQVPLASSANYVINLNYGNCRVDDVTSFVSHGAAGPVAVMLLAPVHQGWFCLLRDLPVLRHRVPHAAAAASNPATVPPHIDIQLHPLLAVAAAHRRPASLCMCSCRNLLTLQPACHVPQVYCPADGSDGSSAGEQFTFLSTSLPPGTTLAPGSPMLIKSVKTGMFCRAVTGSDGLTKIKCDVSQAAASVMTYTGDGFSYNGLAFNNPGGARPVFLSPKPSLGAVAVAPAPSSCNFGRVPAVTSGPGAGSTALSPNGDYAVTLNDKGSLMLVHRATGASTLLGVPAFACLGPFGLVLQPTGNLVVQDRDNRTAWSSGSACQAPSSSASGRQCYSYMVTNSGTLQVGSSSPTGSTGSSIVWSGSGALSGGRQLRRQQLTSSSAPELSCIWSPSGGQAAPVLVSGDGRYEARVGDGGSLQVVDTAAAAVVFTPDGALQGTGQGRLCVRNNGLLLLLGSSGGWLASGGRTQLLKCLQPA